jgi:hypothetical protein
MSPRHRALLLLSLTTLVLMAAILVSGNVTPVDASSHREAPLIAKDFFADGTDTYVWIPQGQTERIVLAASWIPFQKPDSGPYYFWWDETARYYIHVDINGDAVPDFSYELTATMDTVNGETFLHNTGPIASLDDGTWNRPQRITVREIRGDGTETVIVDNALTAPPHIGSKSTPDFPALEQEAIHSANVGGDEIAVYAGQTDDGFFVDLQVFDLLTLRGQDPPVGYAMGNNDPVDTLAGHNVHSLVIELPISRLVDGEPVIGVWSTTERQSMRVLAPGGEQQSGDWVQVSRLGMPLVNEVVIPLALKDAFNGLRPQDDLQTFLDVPLLQEAILNPEVGRLLCALYGVPMPRDTNGDCNTEYSAGNPATGRSDIVEIFLTGMVTAQEFTINTANGPVTLPPGFNVTQPENVQPAEMIRINTAVAGDLCDPQPKRLGLLAGDACGFPNGRRPMDDTVDISLLAVAGAAFPVLTGEDFDFNPALIGVLSDNVNSNDVPFRPGFPYLAMAHSGQERVHDNPQGEPTSVSVGGVTVSSGSAPWMMVAAALASVALVGAMEARRRRGMSRMQ